MIYKIMLDPIEVQLLGRAFELMPYGQIVALVNKVQEQISAQDREVAAEQWRAKVRAEHPEG